MNRIFWFILVGLLNFLSMPFAHGDSMIVTMSAYSPECAADPQGGGNLSKWSHLKPKEHTVNGRSKLVMMAVSSTGGTYDLRGGCYQAKGGDAAKGPAQGMMSAIYSKTFVAGNRCPGCKNKPQVDLPVDCSTPKMNNFKVHDITLTQVECPPEARGYFKDIPLRPLKSAVAGAEGAAQASGTSNGGGNDAVSAGRGYDRLWRLNELLS